MRAAARWRAGLLVVLLAVLGSIVPARTASACSCVYRAEDPVLFEKAAVVFLGTVVDDRRRRSTRTLTFAVERVFKGAATSQQQVRTQADPATCGLELQGAGPFLVHASDAATGLVADLCGGTRPTVRAAGTGGGYPPLPGGGPPGDAPRLETLGAALAVALAALLLAAVLRRRSGRSER